LKALARRYASALVDVAIEHATAQQVKNELAAFVGLLAESADLVNFLASPAVARAGKQAVIEELVVRLGASQMLRNFLFVVVENHRSLLLPQIQEAFEGLLNARLGVAEAQVTSVNELSSQEKTDLARVLERLTGQRVEARYSLDPTLIGGAVVRIGSTIYDGSVREQLNRLRMKLASE
jgi:F-type H+-transporting ATPase subunit delta